MIRTKYNIILLFLWMFLLVNCNKLDIEPTQAIISDLAITNKHDAQRALTGTYDALQSAQLYGRNLIILQDLIADNLKESGTLQEFAEIDNNRILAGNSVILGIWSANYDAINRANNAIEKIALLKDLSETEINNYLGELKFIRAICFFNLVNLFGAVPLKTAPTKNAASVSNITRAPVNIVYNQIIDDLVFAGNNISVSVPGRASNTAATALLARVYLYQKNYEKAKIKATQVIEKSGYGLETNYQNIFTKPNSPEVIFTLKFNPQDNNRLAQYFAPAFLGGRNEVIPTTDFINAFEPGDLRRSATISPENYAFKYDDIATGADDVLVLRLAEMYLVRAEAETNLTNPDFDAVIADINKIRNRAGLPGIAATTKNDLLQAIEKERRIEFAFEGQRWFDLVRTGRAFALIPSVSAANQLLLPIPLIEIQASGIKQNDGY